MDKLPQDVHVFICNYFELPVLYAFSRTCSTFGDVFHMDHLWENFCHRDLDLYSKPKGSSWMQEYKNVRNFLYVFNDKDNKYARASKIVNVMSMSNSVVLTRKGEVWVKGFLSALYNSDSNTDFYKLPLHLPFKPTNVHSSSNSVDLIIWNQDTCQIYYKSPQTYDYLKWKNCKEYIVTDFVNINKGKLLDILNIQRLYFLFENGEIYDHKVDKWINLKEKSIKMIEIKNSIVVLTDSGNVWQIINDSIKQLKLKNIIDIQADYTLDKLRRLKGTNFSFLAVDKDLNLFNDETNLRISVTKVVSTDQVKFLFFKNQVMGIGGTVATAMISTDYITNVPAPVPLFAISNPNCIKEVNRFESTLGFIFPMVLTSEYIHYRRIPTTNESFTCMICGKTIHQNNKTCVYLQHSGKKVGHYVDASCGESHIQKRMLVGEKWTCCGLYSSESGCITGSHVPL